MIQECRRFWSDLFSIPDVPLPLPTGGGAPAAPPAAPAAPTAPATAPATSPRPEARPEATPTEAATDAADAADDAEIEDVCSRCADKYLLITVERHTKKNYGGVWDRTLGDLTMEIIDMPRDPKGSGQTVFTCKTVERGAPNGIRGMRTGESRHMVAAEDVTGVNMHQRSRIRTYGYVTQNGSYNLRPRAGLGVFGNGNSVVSGTRTGVAWHHGSHHRWSVGCILLTQEAATKGSDNKWRFGIAQSYATTLEFREKCLTFVELPTARNPSPVPPERKLERVIVRIEESY